MSFKRYSVALLSGVLLFAGCGESDNAPALPGPVRVSGEEFVSATEYQFVPGSVLETLSLRLDFINPKFDLGIPVRATENQGSGEARLENVEAVLKPLDASLDSNTLAIQLAQTIPTMEIRAFAPDDALLLAYTELGGITLRAANLNDQRIRVGSTFRTQQAVGVVPGEPASIPPLPTPSPPGDTEEPGEPQQPDPTSISFPTDPNLTLRVENIYVSFDGGTVVLEGTASMLAPSSRVLNTVSGDVLPDSDEFPTAILQDGRFSAAFQVKEAGVQGSGDGEDPLALLARLHFTVNQAEILSLGALQTGAQSTLFTPDPARHPEPLGAILPNQLVRIRRLLNGRVEAEFDPANVSTVVNFVQVLPPGSGFPTPVPQLTPPPSPAAPTVFNYFFSMRTERDEDGSGTGPVRLEGLVSETGPFIFRSLGGSQLAGPFNRSDIGGGEGRGNLVLIFDQTTAAEDITGEFQIEQEYPTENVGTDPSAAGTILIIRGFFEGDQVNL